MEGNYTHKPLTKAGNIRILSLQPAPALEDPLICTLEEVDPEHVSYTALSYSWAMEDDRLRQDGAGRFPSEEDYELTHAPGDSSTSKPIVLDGVQILVGENLRDALRRLRDDCDKIARLWVDAVCINQKNDAEKSSQVAMMASIYGRASEVVSWLGEGDEKVNAAVEIPLRCLLADLARGSPLGRRLTLQHSWDWSHRVYRPTREACSVCRYVHVADIVFPHSSGKKAVYGAHQRWKGALTRREDVPLLPVLRRAWYGWPTPALGPCYVTPSSALLQLSRRRYFSRLWVVQEAVLPRPNRVVFQWGGRKLAGNILTVMYRLSIDSDSVQYSLDGFTDPPLDPQSQLPTNLPGWIDYCSAKKCHDPRDRLYALLGCVESPMNIEPDHSRDLKDVYLEFAKHLLAQDGFEALIGNCCGVLAWYPLWYPYVIPTWMPDLRSRFRYLTSVQTRGSMEYARPSISEDGKVLSCHMIYLGTIRHLHFSRARDMHGPDAVVVWQTQRGLLDTAADFPEDREPQGIADGAIIAMLSQRPDPLLKFRFKPSNALPGDILCATRCEKKMILRRAETAGQWEIVGCWYNLRYTHRIRPKERRLYHLV